VTLRHDRIKASIPSCRRSCFRSELGERDILQEAIAVLKLIRERDREYNLFNCPSGGAIRKDIKLILDLEVNERLRLVLKDLGHMLAKEETDVSKWCARRIELELKE
jgi:hypothetical protein